MEIILLERIEKLGQMGDVVTVKDGYARNYLLPQKKALRSNAANRNLFATQRVQLEARNLELRTEAEKVAKKLDKQACALLRQAGENGQLYGSVNARDIAQALTGLGFSVNRRQVELASPIKSLGVVPVQVKLHPEVSVTVNVSVARSSEEADRQISLSEGKTDEEIAAEAFFETTELAEEAVSELSEDEETGADAESVED
ncbi:MAG: 50S ribosomal protein L9 [Sphingomonadales bacterium]